MKCLNFDSSNIKYGSLMNMEGRLELLTQFYDETNQEFKSFLNHSKDKNTLLDVGCSYGAFGLAFAKMDSNKKSYCFDGAINAWLALNQTIELNEMSNLKCYKLLVGDIDNLVNVVYDRHQSLFSYNSNTSELMMRVDTICELFNIKPDCIKIDTEGCDYKVLAGAMNTLKEYKPTIFMEAHPNFLKWHKHSISDIVNVFNEVEYTALDLFGNEVTDYKKYLEMEETDSNRTVWIPK